MSESESPAPEAAVVEPEPELTPSPAPEPAAEPLDLPDRVLAVLALLEERLEESQRLLARQTEIATALHAENQRLKDGELRRAQLPLVRDLIHVQDVLGRLHDPQLESAVAADLLIARDSILEALARNGVEQTRAEAGDPLDPRRHKVAGVEPTDDPIADRTIAEVVRVGFAWEEGTTIRAADVRVFKHVPAAQAPASRQSRV